MLLAVGVCDVVAFPIGVVYCVVVVYDGVDVVDVVGVYVGLNMLTGVCDACAGSVTVDSATEGCATGVFSAANIFPSAVVIVLVSLVDR